MIVREVHLYHVRMPLLEPWVTAYGSQDSIESLFVNLKFDSGDGWGECALHRYHYIILNTQKVLLLQHMMFLLHRLLARRYHQLTSYSRYFGVKGHEFTRSVFDSACGTHTLSNVVNLMVIDWRR